MSAPAERLAGPAQLRRQVLGNLRYIDSAPLANCQVTVAKLEREYRAAMGNGWAGQDGTCVFSNARGVQAPAVGADRGGWSDPGQRAKIVAQVMADGTEVPIGVIRAAAAKGGRFPANVVVWPGYQNDKRLTIQQVVLRVHNPALFARYLAWADGTGPDQSQTYMIGHRCANGNLGCITGDHLFLVTGSVNQQQRNCYVPRLTPCAHCDHFPAITECYCSKNIPDPAMPDGKCAVCIPCPPNPGRALQQQQQPQQPVDVPRLEHDRIVKALEDEVQKAKSAAHHYHSLARLAMTRNQDYERQYRELEQRFQSQQGHHGV